MEKTLASDNFSGVHPEVMAAIQKANVGHAMAYGGDAWTLRLNELFKEVFGAQAQGFIVCNGTAANICGMAHVLSSWQGVICPASAHIATDECGALAAHTGCSLLPVQGHQGKITEEQCSSFLHARGNQHHVQPALLSITQSTELGTVYTIEEMKRLARFAHQEGLLFHVDGARLCNAAASLNVPLKALTTDVGVDLLSFGGTKNGLMGAEALIFLKQGLADQFSYERKQQMQLMSKMRFLSAQMIALLEGDLWKRNAQHANQMAKLLEQGLRTHCPQLSILYPVEANALFVQLPAIEIAYKLQKKSFFWIWDHDQAIVRWMTSWDTEPELIEAFVQDLRDVL